MHDDDYKVSWEEVDNTLDAHYRLVSTELRLIRLLRAVHRYCQAHGGVPDEDDIGYAPLGAAYDDACEYLDIDPRRPTRQSK